MHQIPLPINTQQQQQQHEQVNAIVKQIPLLISTQKQEHTERIKKAEEAKDLARLQSSNKKQLEEKLDTKRPKELQKETQKLNEEAILNIQQRNAITAVTKLASLLDSITNDDDKTEERDEQFTAITQFFGNTLNERKQGKIKTILRTSTENNTTKATRILQAIADDKKSRDSMYALLGLGGAAAAYMLGRKHGGKTEKRRHSSSQNRRG